MDYSLLLFASCLVVIIVILGSSQTQVSVGKTPSLKFSLKSIEASPSEVASHKILQLESATPVANTAERSVSLTKK